MELLFSSGSMVYTGSCFSGIYGIQCHINSKWYVGQSIHAPERVASYLVNICENQRLISASFAKHGKENFSCYKIEECEVVQLDEKEVFWGTELKSLAPIGYNLRLGKGNSIVSDETKQKLRISKKKQDKLYGHPSLGRKHSEETLKKMRKPKSEETKRKMKASAKKSYCEGRVAWNKGIQHSTIKGGTV